MTPDSRSSLVNKLTLLVLSLILVCLVLLVVRAYQKPLSPETAAVTVETAAPTEVEPEPIAPPPPTNPPTRRPTVVNVPRSIVSPAPASPPSPPEPAPAEVLQPVAQSTLVVNSAVTEIASGGGVQSVTGGASTSGQPEIVGLVTLVGQPKPEIPIELGPSCGRINPGRVTTRHYVVGPGGGLANVVVWLENPSTVPEFSFGPPNSLEVPLLDQVGCMYEPYILGVQAGQPFNIRNSDPELHNVHATPKINREFNFGQPLKGQVTQKVFAKPEFFTRIKCDIHPWMFAYINVMPHPYFAITDTNGVFRLPTGFPPGGPYILSARHHKLNQLRQMKFSIAENERRALQFQFTLDSRNLASPSPSRP